MPPKELRFYLTASSGYVSLLGESCGERWLGKGGRDVRGQGTGASAASVRDGGGMCQPLTRPPSETESWI